MIGLKRVQTKQCWRPGDRSCWAEYGSRRFPEKGTTPESGGGTATQSRAVVTAAKLAPLADSQPPRRLCKKRTGTASGPTAVARARAQSHSWQATRDDWRRSHSCFVAMDSSETATCGSGRADTPVRQPFDPPPTARLLGTALVMIKKQPLKTVRFLKLRPR